jgi:hypothetical protein
VEFPALLTERRCFEVIAECYNEIRTTTAIGVTNSSLPGPSKKIPKSTIVNQTSKLISQYVSLAKYYIARSD